MPADAPIPEAIFASLEDEQRAATGAVIAQLNQLLQEAQECSQREVEDSTLASG